MYRVSILIEKKIYVEFSMEISALKFLEPKKIV